MQFKKNQHQTINERFMQTQKISIVPSQRLKKYIKQIKKLLIKM